MGGGLGLDVFGSEGDALSSFGGGGAGSVLGGAGSSLGGVASAGDDGM